MYEGCEVCQEPINNPECERCYFEEIKAWLRDYSKNEFEIYPEERIDNDVFSEDKCIFCKTHTFSICSGCFFRGVFNRLNYMGLQEEIIADFSKMFMITEEDEEIETAEEDELLVTI